MFKVRDWERFQFLVDYEHLQVLIHESLGLFMNMFTRHSLVLIHKVPFLVQHKKILERTLPEALKLSIARKIENNLFSKVLLAQQL